MSLGNPVAREYAIRFLLAAGEGDTDEQARLYADFIGGGGAAADLAWEMFDLLPPGAHAVLVAEAVVRIAEHDEEES